MIDVRGKRVLVTGGTGFLGRHVVKLLQESGANVETHSRLQFDLTDRCNALFAVTQPELVVHLAAAVGGIAANAANPAGFLSTNLQMGLNIVDCCRRFKVTKLITVGTTCSYPQLCPIPFKESDLWNGYPEPVTAPYGLAKRVLLSLQQTYRVQHGLAGGMAILANLYGLGDNFNAETAHVVPALIRRFVEARDNQASQVEVWGSPEVTRELLDVRDAAEAVIRMLERYDDSEPINIGTGTQTSMQKLVKMISCAVGYRGEVVWNSSKPSGQPRRVLDISRAQEKLGWYAERFLYHGIPETVRWYESRRG